jgi:dolichyldiphosphatase
MSTAAALPPLPVLKSFSLTHILYDPAHHPLLSIPLTLLSLSPIFLFVSYFTLVVFTRRLTTLNLALGSIVNELLSWSLKRIWKGDRPYTGHLEIGDGYGMPSSHSQAAGFLLAWGVGYALTLDRRSGSQQTAGTKPEGTASTAVQTVRRARTGIFVFGLLLWSALTAYSR